MVVAGLGCLAGLVALVAWWSMRRVLDGGGTVSLIQAIGALGLTALGSLGLGLYLGGPLAGFLLMPAAAAAGIVAALPTHGDNGRGGSSDDEPPWWPSFEHELRRYRERTRV